MPASDIFGWIGTIGYALCAYPQIRIAFKTGKVSLSGAFLITYLTAAMLSFIYAVHAGDMIAAISFFITVASWLILLKYKFFPVCKEK